MTHKKSLIVGARTFLGNPFDGQTLAEQLEQTRILTEDHCTSPKQVYVDLGFRGVDHANPGVEIIHRGKYKSMLKADRKRLKRRQSIEPTIGYLKADHGMRRTWLKGATGDALHRVLCAAGFNLKWLMRTIALYLPLFAVMALIKNILQAVKSEQSKRFRLDQARLVTVEN